MNETKNTNCPNSKIQELQIEKYPMAESPHLIEYFLIMGYEESYIQEKIIKNFNNKMVLELEEEEQKNRKINPESKIFNEYKCRNLPTILSSIGSNFAKPIPTQLLIGNVFPIPPSILYTTTDNFIYEPYPLNVIFSNIQNNIVNIGYAFIFYENRIILNKVKIYIPKAFVILSQYPFFNTYFKLCQELLDNQFKNKLLQIPIEIQLYNIINFIPAPVNEQLNITFFPSNELSEITRCESDSNLINLNRQQIYNLSQLSGYRQSEINISVIFCILPVDIIIQTYIQLLTGKTIAVFSKNLEVLNMTIYLFLQFFYPLAHDETVNCLSPTRYFCTEFSSQNIVGFLCDYNEIDNYNPFKEVEGSQFNFLSEDEENEDLDFNLFGCDFVLDLDNKVLEYVENNKEMENYDEYRDQTLKILELTKKILSPHRECDNSYLESSLKKLINNLKEISFKLTYLQNKEKEAIPDYFTTEYKFNRRIQNAFYQFNLDISYEYYQKISNYNGNYSLNKSNQSKTPKTLQESGLNVDDYLFYILFSNTLYCNILNNFVGGYSENEPLIYKTPRLIFENFLTLKKLANNSNQSNDKNDKNEKNDKKDKDKKDNNNNINIIDDYLDIIDEIYINKNKEKNITFLDFYKYYKNHLVVKVYNLVSNKYVEAKINKVNRQNIKYFYEYKTIDLDKDLLLEYIYILDEIKNEEKNKLFHIEDNNYLIYKPINQKITSRFIYNSFEEYFIDSKYVEFTNVIIICILNVLGLSVHNKTLIPYTLTIYSLFQNLSISVRKYVEIILSIALRQLLSETNPNSFLYLKYFNLYQFGIEANGLFPNDELISLEKEIQYFKDNQNKRNNEFFDERYKKIEKVETKKLYSLNCNKKPKDIIPMIQNLSFNVNIKCTLKFKSKYYKNKEIKIVDIYSPKTIYNITNKMLDNYYNDLNFNNIDKNEYEKIIIHLLYYSQLLENKLPKDINRFLFYCFDLQY